MWKNISHLPAIADQTEINPSFMTFFLGSTSSLEITRVVTLQQLKLL